MSNILYISVYNAVEHEFVLYELTEQQSNEFRATKDKEKYIKDNLYCHFDDDCGFDVSEKAAIYIEKADGSQESMEFGI